MQGCTLATATATAATAFASKPGDEVGKKNFSLHAEAHRIDIAVAATLPLDEQTRESGRRSVYFASAITVAATVEKKTQRARVRVRNRRR